MREPRCFAVVLIAAFVLGACSSGSTGHTPTTVTSVVQDPASTTAPTVDESTTTEAEGPVDICPRSFVWEPGTTYVADCFVVPVSFEPVDPGWRSSGAGEGWMKVSWTDSGDPSLRVRVGVISYRSSATPAEVIDAIVAFDRIAARGVPQEVTVAGSRALSVDVDGSPEPGDHPDPCTGDTPVWFDNTSFGHPILAIPSGVMGVGACHRVRVWVLDVRGQSITFIGGTADTSRHEQAVAKIEELFESMSLDVEAGS